MTTNATSGQEPDASNPDHQPTSEADGETVHSVGDWQLTVRGDGSVEAIETTSNGQRRWSTADDDRVPLRASYRYGKTVEGVLARYAHETRFDRDPNTEHGATLRDGIITALQRQCDAATCARCEARATHVCHVNAPTGPNTSLVCGDHANERTYVTLHALDSATEAEA
ncbi:MAG TPA: hypothetical protein VFJ06_14170 [Halococcus sp.]|nr:hypothetical protein [Halococcus sp.]